MLKFNRLCIVYGKNESDGSGDGGGDGDIGSMYIFTVYIANGIAKCQNAHII